MARISTFNIHLEPDDDFTLYQATAPSRTVTLDLEELSLFFDDLAHARRFLTAALETVVHAIDDQAVAAGLTEELNP